MHVDGEEEDLGGLDLAGEVRNLVDKLELKNDKAKMTRELNKEIERCKEICTSLMRRANVTVVNCQGKCQLIIQDDNKRAGGLNKKRINQILADNKGRVVDDGLIKEIMEPPADHSKEPCSKLVAKFTKKTIKKPSSGF